MAMKRHKPEEIVGDLGQADVLHSRRGRPLLRQHGTDGSRTCPEHGYGCP